MMEERFEALLLVGPTGSGKTPLGCLLENGRRCLHFDFGENLRRLVTRGQPDHVVSADDLRFLRDLLARGVLLEDQDFPVAERIVRSFLRERSAAHGTVIVLNGLPRHVGQAQALAGLLDVRVVVHLRCVAETVFARIAGNAGGDRHGRTDDSLEAVRQKLAVFERRTAPLVDWYRASHARIVEIEVTDRMTPDETWAELGQSFRFR
jgi:adenylate kinase family enzyme